MQEIKHRPWEKYHRDSMKLEIPKGSFYSILEETVKNYGNQTAITFAGGNITYQALKRRVDQLAGGWKKRNFKKGERIGLMVGNHPSYIISYYAALALGLIVVQINPAYTKRELFKILTDSQVTYIVADAVSLKTVNEMEAIYTFKEIFVAQKTSETSDSVLSIEEVIQEEAVLESPVFIDVERDVAVIQYTGGTTGEVKGAMLTHQNIITNVLQSYAMYKERATPGKEIVLAATPLYHVYAMTSAMNLGIYMGANILLIEKFRIDEVMKLVKDYQPTFFPGVPQMYNAFINYPDAEMYGLDSLKVCSSGSAPLPIEVHRRFEAITGTKILEGYGMSETSPTTHRTPITGEVKVGSIGIPVPETDCRIIDQEQHEMGTNSVGELLIKGPQVMKGYWNNQTTTNQALQNGWLHTGDLAMMDEDGYFYIVGRKKEMIIMGGFNIYPQEVESVLYEHPNVKESAVVGLPDREKGEIAKAYVVPKEGCSIDVEELTGFCYKNLTPYKVPKEFEVLEKLPRNTVGKLLKRKLVDQEKKNGKE
ncbi:long-chain-fatty-acid--CoA ligase [Virgibacillus sp. FSP13]